MKSLSEHKRHNIRTVDFIDRGVELAASRVWLGDAQRDRLGAPSRISVPEGTPVGSKWCGKTADWQSQEWVNAFSHVAHLAKADDARSTNLQDKPVVFVIDDDVSVRGSLESLIHSAGWWPEIFGSAREFFFHPRPKVPSCLILDVNLPGISGLDLQEIIAVERANMPIIFVTAFGDVSMTVKAMKAGAIEFLMKPFHADMLLSAVKEALERSRITLEFEFELHALQERHASLSRREQEVMALVVTGLLNKQVAFELAISEITVKAHRGQVMRKMKASSLPDLVNMAARLGTAHYRLGQTQPSPRTERRSTGMFAKGVPLAGEQLAT